MNARQAVDAVIKRIKADPKGQKSRTQAVRRPIVIPLKQLSIQELIARLA